MDSNFWNSRYSEPGFAYGTRPNDYLLSVASTIPANSKVLCIADGEGRNSVYLAELGHQVTAIDFSEAGLNKAKKLAEEKGLQIETIHADLKDYHFQPETYDVVVSIFAHFPDPLRKKVHQGILKSLKKDGLIILEAYHPEQLRYKTGGPQFSEMLYSEEMMKSDFASLSTLDCHKVEREVQEGKYHAGLSATTQLFGKN
jgi:2-polyprenyl-3-methyl-5-hydroxy-6-metoxy-1,4-benzoquinol methylase